MRLLLSFFSFFVVGTFSFVIEIICLCFQKEENLFSVLVGVLNKHRLVNLWLLRVRPGWCTKRHEDYTGSGKTSLRLVCCCCSCYQYWKWFVVGGKKQSREGRVPSLWWNDRKGCRELGRCLAVYVVSCVFNLSIKSRSPLLEEAHSLL